MPKKHPFMISPSKSTAREELGGIYESMMMESCVFTDAGAEDPFRMLSLCDTPGRNRGGENDQDVDDDFDDNVKTYFFNF